MLILPILLALAGVAAAAQEQQFADLKPYRVGYRTLGTLNAEKSNADRKSTRLNSSH